MAGDHTFQGSKPGAGAPDNVYRVGRSCVQPQERQRWLGSRMPHGVSDIQEPLEEALPGMEQGPLLLPGFSTLTSLGQFWKQVPLWMVACLRCSHDAACGGCDCRGCVPQQSDQGLPEQDLCWLAMFVHQLSWSRAPVQV